MLLTLQNLVGYLADRQLLPEEAFLAGDLFWKQLPGRHNVLVVKSQEGKGHFLKQLKIRDDENIRLMRMETVLEMLVTSVPLGKISTLTLMDTVM